MPVKKDFTLKEKNAIFRLIYKGKIKWAKNTSYADKKGLIENAIKPFFIRNKNKIAYVKDAIKNKTLTLSTLGLYDNKGMKISNVHYTKSGKLNYKINEIAWNNKVKQKHITKREIREKVKDSINNNIKLFNIDKTNISTEIQKEQFNKFSGKLSKLVEIFTNPVYMSNTNISFYLLGSLEEGEYIQRENFDTDVVFNYFKDIQNHFDNIENIFTPKNRKKIQNTLNEFRKIIWTRSDILDDYFLKDNIDNWTFEEKIYDLRVKVIKYINKNPYIKNFFTKNKKAIIKEQMYLNE